MVVNSRAREINRDTRKLTLTSILIIYIYIYILFVKQLTLHFQAIRDRCWSYEYHIYIIYGIKTNQHPSLLQKHPIMISFTANHIICQTQCITGITINLATPLANRERSSQNQIYIYIDTHTHCNKSKYSMFHFLFYFFT